MTKELAPRSPFLNDGTIHPALLKLEQEDDIRSEWGVSDNNRRAKFYRLTRLGRKQVERAAREVGSDDQILARFLRLGEERMRRLRAWVIRLVGTFRGGPPNRDLAEELGSDPELHMDENIRAGMTPEEAGLPVVGSAL